MGYHGRVAEPGAVADLAAHPEVLVNAGRRCASRWSELARHIFEHRYAARGALPSATMPVPEPTIPPFLWRRAGRSSELDSDRPRKESIEAAIERLVGAWAYAGWINGAFDDTGDAAAFVADAQELMHGQFGAPNSPQWFNVGFWWAYGLTGAEDHLWHRANDHGVLEQRRGAWRYPISQSCFILAVDDRLLGRDGILEHWHEEALIFKYGAGTGSNFTPIRAKGSPIGGGGAACGLMSVLRAGDRCAAMFGDHGTTRRAAKMVVLDASHPEALALVRWKRQQEATGRALLGALRDPVREQVAGSGANRALVDIGFQTEGCCEPDPGVTTWVADRLEGQLSNNSIRLDDAFMRAVLAPGSQDAHADWRQVLWDEICKAAWACGDPGLHFVDAIERGNSCANLEAIAGSNSCSEFMFLEDTCCSIFSLNLAKFWSDAGFDGDGFERACRLATRILDLSIDSAGYPTRRIAQRTLDFRPIGVGFTNLGGLLSKLGLAYGSPESLGITAAISALMTATTLGESARIGERSRPFPRLAEVAGSLRRVLDRAIETLETSAARGPTEQVDLDFSHPLSRALADRAMARFRSFRRGQLPPFRNGFVTLVAPTGTTSLILDCDTTGIEPEYALCKTKRLAGGAALHMPARWVSDLLARLDYSDAAIATAEHAIGQGRGDQFAQTIREQHIPLFRCAEPGPLGEAWRVPTAAHLDIMAAAQPFLSGAISKTVNLPHRAEVADVAEIYSQAWGRGLKAIAVYRNGSKLAQPLS